MAQRIFTYDSSKTTGGRNNNKATMMIRQTELNLLGDKKQAPFTGYSTTTGNLKESFVSNRTGENSTNVSFDLGKFVSHQDLEQRDKALTKFIQENVSKQIIHAIEKFKTHSMKELVDKTLEPLKEELENLRKLIKNNEEIVTNLQSEKVNWEQTLNKIEMVLEKQFASATGSYSGFNEAQPNKEMISQFKEEINNIQINIKSLKETIIPQIQDQLTLGLSTLAIEQEKIEEFMKNSSQHTNVSSNSIEHFKKFEDNLSNLEKKLEKFNEFIHEQKQIKDANSSKYEELLQILKSEKKEGIIIEDSGDSERFRKIEGRLENCLAELHKTKETFEGRFAKKFDNEIAETFKEQNNEVLSKKFDNDNVDNLRQKFENENHKNFCNEEIERRIEEKPAVESVFEEKEEKKEKKEEEKEDFLEKKEILFEKFDVLNENIEENKSDAEKIVVINTTPMKEFLSEITESEKKEANYEEWLAKNKALVEADGKTPEKLENKEKFLKNILEGEEGSVISEIKPKEEEFNSEIQRDFDSINNALETNLKDQKNEENTPEKKMMIKNQGSESMENEDDDEIIYNIDEQGFLIDEQGNYILDDNGKMVKLSPEHIEYLRESNMYEEEFASIGKNEK